MLKSLAQTLTRAFSQSTREGTSPNYRVLPIFSGVVVPFSVLLAIPSLTGRWYIQTGNDSTVVDSKPNTSLLQVAMTFSLVCAILANGCLVVRFAERGVKPMTLLSILLLAIHDIISIITVTIFGVEHRQDDGFTYGQPFWMTVCSTLTSTITNVTLIIDYISTPNFATSGSGLTHKQRNLVVIIIVLFFYLAIGALVQSVLLKLNFIDALYFTVVSIETVGFGDIHPTDTGSRIFTMIYVTFGILNLAVAVGSTRDALLEGMVVYLQNRIRALKQKDRKRRSHGRWRHAVKWRLRAQRLPIWIDTSHERATNEGSAFTGLIERFFRRKWGGEKDTERREGRLHMLGHRRLNVEALTIAQLEAAALEAGAPLIDLLPPGFVPFNSDPAMWMRLPPPEDGPSYVQSPLTHIRLGRMINLLASFAFAATHGENGIPADDSPNDDVDDDNEEDDGSATATNRMGIPMSRTMTLDGPVLINLVENEEKMAFNVRLAAALALFLVFWMGGSAIFSKTEGWPFGIAVYFCFMAFTTLGYGDFSPQTPAGRSIFVAWALLGIGAMTILIAILSDAYSTSYKQVIHTEIYQKAVNSDFSNQTNYPAGLVQTKTFSRSNTSSILPSNAGGQPEQVVSGGGVRSVSFAQPPTLDEKGGEGPCGNNPGEAKISKPVELGPTTLAESSEFQDAVQRHVQALRVLLNTEKASRPALTLQGPTKSNNEMVLQTILDDLDRRLLGLTNLTSNL